MRERCETCSQPLPLPPSEKAPPTRKMAYWIPADIADDHKALIDSVAEFLGCFDQPYYQAKVGEFCAAFARQHEELRGVLGSGA